jgi:hypothetical protein
VRQLPALQFVKRGLAPQSQIQAVMALRKVLVWLGVRPEGSPVWMRHLRLTSNMDAEA